MTLDEAVSEFEAQFTHIDDRSRTSIAPNGKPFIIVSLDGDRPEGHRLPRAASEDEASERWLRAAKKLASNSTALYWRCRPQIEGKGKPTIYSRMAFGMTGESVVYDRELDVQ